MANKNPKNPEQDSLFREIDEDIRQENLEKLWKKYGTVLIGAAVGLVVLVAGYKGWQTYDTDRRENAAAQFLNAAAQAEAGKPEDAQLVFAQLSDNGPGGYAMLAQFRSAALLAQQGDTAGAAAAYGAIAADSSMDALYRDLADVLAALAEVDSADPKAIRARMDRINVDANPWRFSAREISALAALRDGNKTDAQTLYDGLANDSTTPSSLRQRAQAMAQHLKD